MKGSLGRVVLCRRGRQFKLTSWNLIVHTAHVDGSSPTLSKRHHVKGAKSEIVSSRLARYPQPVQRDIPVKAK